VKKLLTLVLFLHLTVLAIGCGDGNEAPAEPPPGSGEDAVEDVPDPNRR
jgi:hypothetical protein